MLFEAAEKTNRIALQSIYTENVRYVDAADDPIASGRVAISVALRREISTPRAYSFFFSSNFPTKRK